MNWLMENGKLRPSPSDGKPWKELYLYQNKFAPIVAKKAKRVRAMCKEAERTFHAVDERRAEREKNS